MSGAGRRRVVDAASVLALVALALFAWSIVDPRPFPIIVAMSVGQVLGTISFVTYIAVVAADVMRLVRGRVLARRPPDDS